MKRVSERARDQTPRPKIDSVGRLLIGVGEDTVTVLAQPRHEASWPGRASAAPPPTP